MRASIMRDVVMGPACASEFRSRWSIFAHIPKLNRPRDGSGIGRGDARAVRAGFPVTVPKQGDLGERIRDEFPAPAHYHRYLKVLVVAEALVAEVLGNFSAMPNCFCICLELDPNCISMRDAIFHIEEKLLHAITSEDTNPVCQVSFRTGPERPAFWAALSLIAPPDAGTTGQDF